MKKIICLLALSVWTLAASAQNIQVQTSTFEEYLPLLNEAGYKVYTFDISEFLNDTYQVNSRIKEYKNNEEINSGLHNFGFVNRRMIKDFPEENQKKIMEENLAVNPEAGIYSQASKMTIGLSPYKVDSLKSVFISLDGMGTGGRRLKLQGLQSPGSDELFYSYQDRPFKMGKFEEGTFIPLVLFGSFWLDEKYNVFRFCGEKEIDPEMTAEILKHIPHYYVIGVEFVKKE